MKLNKRCTAETILSGSRRPGQPGYRVRASVAPDALTWAHHPGLADQAETPASPSHSRIFDFGMAPTFMEAIWPPLNSIRVGTPRTP